MDVGTGVADRPRYRIRAGPEEPTSDLIRGVDTGFPKSSCSNEDSQTMVRFNVIGSRSTDRVRYQLSGGAQGPAPEQILLQSGG